jgi:hypothetical protein
MSSPTEVPARPQPRRLRRGFYQLTEGSFFMNTEISHVMTCEIFASRRKT